mmetsp:Transcript_19162/g.36687  ORF Transcript_19162/g.36687 Transcript_19162/m.36687 type:complete len:256 (+) Transcript_19162:484-1251(+)
MAARWSTRLGKGARDCRQDWDALGHAGMDLRLWGWWLGLSTLHLRAAGSARILWHGRPWQLVTSCQQIGRLTCRLLHRRLFALQGRCEAIDRLQTVKQVAPFRLHQPLNHFGQSIVLRLIEHGKGARRFCVRLVQMSLQSLASGLLHRYFGCCCRVRDVALQQRAHFILEVLQLLRTRLRLFLHIGCPVLGRARFLNMKRCVILHVRRDTCYGSDKFLLAARDSFSDLSIVDNHLHDMRRLLRYPCPINARSACL